MQVVEEVTQEAHLKAVSELAKEIEGAREKAKGALFTLDIARSEIVRDDKLAMEFNLRPALAKKQAAHIVPDFNPFLNPCPDLLIKDLGNSHRLLFNKFNIYDNHLLVVTRDFESQREQVSRGDLVNAGLVCEALQGIVFFNGGELSGASQPHKHLQILPNKARELPIFSAVLQWVQSLPEEKHQAGEVIRFEKFEFLHGIVPIRPIRPCQSFQPLGELLFKAYQSLFDQLITKNKEKYQSISDYNIIACDSFMMMAIRRKQHAFDDISVNSLGYMGSLLFKTEESMLQFMKNHGPSGILRDISLPVL